MGQSISRRARSSITIYDPEKGLKTIAVAEAGERHWARAKDATELFKSIEAKLTAQAEYVVWRDGTVVPSQKRGVGRGVDKRVSALKSALPAADPGDVVAHRWRQRFFTKNGKGIYEIDEEKLAVALNDARMRCARVCEQENMGTIRGTEGTGEFERYTPPEYIEVARQVLGTIDLDPASNNQAQGWIRAEKFFTAVDGGLEEEWHGSIWLNPPYHRDLAPLFIKKLVAEINAGHVKAAILLVNNSTDTEWFDVAVRACASVCFSHGRIKFKVPQGEDVLPTQGQAFLYFGRAVKRFEDTFCAIGACLRPSRQYDP